jgi:hypothetical protein
LVEKPHLNLVGGLYLDYRFRYNFTKETIAIRIIVTKHTNKSNIKDDNPISGNFLRNFVNLG